MNDSHPTSLVTTRTNLPALSAVAACDACFHTRSRGLSHWTLPTSNGGLRLAGARRPVTGTTRQLAGHLGVGHGQVVPVEVDLVESRRRCVVAVRPSAPVGRSAAGTSHAAYVRAANEAAEAIASALEDTVRQWVAAIDDHVGRC